MARSPAPCRVACPCARVARDNRIESGLNHAWRSLRSFNASSTTSSRSRLRSSRASAPARSSCSARRRTRAAAASASTTPTSSRRCSETTRSTRTRSSPRCAARSPRSSPSAAARRSPSARGARPGLELMDESLVEVDIEISRAMQLIDSTAEWELRELQTFTSTLIGQSHVSAESNPFRPLVYATALWDAGVRGRRLADPARDRPAHLGRSRCRAAEERRAAASTRLESQGIEPGIYRTVVLPSGASFGGRSQSRRAPAPSPRCSPACRSARRPVTPRATARQWRLAPAAMLPALLFAATARRGAAPSSSRR